MQKEEVKKLHGKDYVCKKDNEKLVCRHRKKDMSIVFFGNEAIVKTSKKIEKCKIIDTKDKKFPKMLICDEKK